MADLSDLKYYVRKGFLTGTEDECAVYEFEGRLLHDGVIQEKKRLAMLAGARCCPTAIEVIEKMSAQEFSALRKRVARVLWFKDHANAN